MSKKSKKSKRKIGENEIEMRRHPFSYLFMNNCQSVPVRLPSGHGFKTDTTCCALALYSLKNDISDEELELLIQKQTNEAKLQWQPWSRVSGETCMMVVTVHPCEAKLEVKLGARGFKLIHAFSRRNGYPQNAHCALWVLNVKEIKLEEIKPQPQVATDPDACYHKNGETPHPTLKQ